MSAPNNKAANPQSTRRPRALTKRGSVLRKRASVPRSSHGAIVIFGDMLHGQSSARLRDATNRLTSSQIGIHPSPLCKLHSVAGIPVSLSGCTDF